MRPLTQLTNQFEGVGEFAEYARHLILSGGSPYDALARAEGTNLAPRVERLLKAAASAGTTVDPSWGGVAVDGQIVVSAFVENLKSVSLFYRLIADNAIIRAPLRTRVLASISDATAWIRVEGEAIPVAELALKDGGIDIRQAAAILITTTELVESTATASRAFFNRELRNAVAVAVDAEFFSGLLDSGTPSLASSGHTLADMRADVRALLDAVIPGSAPDARLYWVAAEDVGIRISTLDDGRNQMGPKGGSFMSLPALVSKAIPEGTLALVDGSGIAGDNHTITVDASSQTTLQMATNPSQNSATGTGSNMTSLFQTGSVALMARAEFGFEKIRDNAVATLSDIEWA